MSDNNEKEKENIVIEGEVEETTDRSVNGIIEKYGGAILGGLIAIILCFTRPYRLLIALLVIIGGVFLGNYIQKNKDDVKIKLKELIDKF